MYEIQIFWYQFCFGIQNICICDVKDGSGCYLVIVNIGGFLIQVQFFEVFIIYLFEICIDYCVGECILYILLGSLLFDVWYIFDGVECKVKLIMINFCCVVELFGEFVIMIILDKLFECKVFVNVVKMIYFMLVVKISRGKNVCVDIYEGGEVEILFEFWGMFFFEFMYICSMNVKKGQKSVVLEMRYDISYEYSKVIWVSQEGMYEVVVIKDKFCVFLMMGGDEKGDRKGQKKLGY